MHAEDSSLVNVKSLVFTSVAVSPTGIACMQTDQGVDYLSRVCYSEPLFFDRLAENVGFAVGDEDADALLFGLRCFAAEAVALRYLNRAEHSRVQLARKLRKKGFSAAEYKPPLDYLTQIGALDDRRFAAAWLELRVLSRYEGRERLFAELLSRGVSQEIARGVLRDHFQHTCEQEVCEKAVKQYARRGKTRRQMFAALIRRGFSYALVRAACDNTGL